jgi:hypothetical protein
LLQEGVDERGFAMIDVGDDRHVANVVSELHAARVTRKTRARFPDILP